MRQTVVGIVAGEASGDLLGSHLIAALKQRRPDLHFVGIGGPKMASQGMEILFPTEKLAVNGYVEVLRHYRELVGIRNQVKKYFTNTPPAVFIAIDAPDFNLDLELALRRRGITTIHYVSPSIWAWRGERIHKIKKAVSHMLALFPHEPRLYQQENVKVDYVGHPLADMLPVHPNRVATRELMRISEHAKVFALLPGSRQSEVRQLADVYIQTAEMILQQVPQARFLVPLITRQTREIFDQAIKDNNAQELPITLLYGHAHEALIASDVALVASGTATLECALLKRPMVITYRLPKLTYWIMKRKSYQPYVGLPNILLGEFVVPELIQDQATPEQLSAELLALLQNKEQLAEIEQKFHSLHRVLKQNTAQKAAQAILPYLS